MPNLIEDNEMIEKMKCSKCKRKAKYDSPMPLCEKHWVDWWTEPDIGDGHPLTPKEREKYRKEVLQELKRK
jgi:hypothetical protein